MKSYNQELYFAVFGSMVAQQVLEFMSSGRGAVNDRDMDRIVEEADTIAVMAVNADIRRTSK